MCRVISLFCGYVLDSEEEPGLLPAGPKKNKKQKQLHSHRLMAGSGQPKANLGNIWTKASSLASREITSVNYFFGLHVHRGNGLKMLLMEVRQNQRPYSEIRNPEY